MKWSNGKTTAIFFTMAALAALALLTSCGGGTSKAPPQASGSGNQAKQEAPKEAFPSKDITFVVPVSPGGGFDTYARILAPTLQKYLPQKPNVVVKNMPGGEWRVGINEMYKAKPDGYTIGIFNIPGNVTAQIVGKAEYDLNKVTWLGRITDTTYVMAVSPKSKLKSLDDIKKAKKVKAGVVGISSTAGLSVAISAEEMGFEVELVNYDGSSEAILSTVRGDTQLALYPYPTLKKFVVDAHDLSPVWVYAGKRLKDLPDVPTIEEVGYPQLLDVVRLEYLVGTTPGVPEDRSGILRDAFQKAVADQDFQKMMNEANQPANPANAQQATQIINDAIRGYEKYKDLILKYSPK